MRGRMPLADEGTTGRVKNLVALQVGTLIVERYLKTKPTGNAGKLNVAQWECRCTACDTLQVKSRRQLVAGTAKCSTCHRRFHDDLAGKRFGRWLVVALAPPPPDGYPESYWRCRCDCGTWRDVRRGYLTSGESKSCGCLFDDVNPDVMRKARRARWRRHRRSR
jgi:hypothetical protein